MTLFEMRVYKIVEQIPKGMVMTYKQIAILLGNKNLARAVGNALHKNKDLEKVKCYKVVNSKGRISRHFAFGGSLEQKKLLLADGVEFISSDCVALEKHLYKI